MTEATALIIGASTSLDPVLARFTTPFGGSVDGLELLSTVRKLALFTVRAVATSAHVRGTELGLVELSVGGGTTTFFLRPHAMTLAMVGASGAGGLLGVILAAKVDTRIIVQRPCGRHIVRGCRGLGHGGSSRSSLGLRSRGSRHVGASTYDSARRSRPREGDILAVAKILTGAPDSPALLGVLVGDAAGLGAIGGGATRSEPKQVRGRGRGDCGSRARRRRSSTGPQGGAETSSGSGSATVDRASELEVGGHAAQAPTAREGFGRGERGRGRHTRCGGMRGRAVARGHRASIGEQFGLGEVP